MCVCVDMETGGCGVKIRVHCEYWDSRRRPDIPRDPERDTPPTMHLYTALHPFAHTYYAYSAPAPRPLSAHFAQAHSIQPLHLPQAQST